MLSAENDTCEPQEAPSPQSIGSEASLLEDVKRLGAAILHLGNWASLDVEFRKALSSLASALGVLISSDIYNDSIIIGEQVRQLSFGNSKEWLNSRNILLV